MRPGGERGYKMTNKHANIKFGAVMTGALLMPGLCAAGSGLIGLGAGASPGAIGLTVPDTMPRDRDPLLGWHRVLAGYGLDASSAAVVAAAGLLFVVTAAHPSRRALPAHRPDPANG